MGEPDQDGVDAAERWVGDDPERTRREAEVPDVRPHDRDLIGRELTS